MSAPAKPDTEKVQPSSVEGKPTQAAEEFAKDWLQDQAILRGVAYLTGEQNALTRRLEARDAAIAAEARREALEEAAMLLANYETAGDKWTDRVVFSVKANVCAAIRKLLVDGGGLEK